MKLLFNVEMIQKMEEMNSRRVPVGSTSHWVISWLQCFIVWWNNFRLQSAKGSYNGSNISFFWIGQICQNLTSVFWRLMQRSKGFMSSPCPSKLETIYWFILRLKSFHCDGAKICWTTSEYRFEMIFDFVNHFLGIM